MFVHEQTPGLGLLCTELLFLSFNCPAFTKQTKCHVGKKTAYFVSSITHIF